MVGVIGIDSMGQIGDFRGGLAGVKKIVVAYRRGKSFRYHSKHAYPAGAYFCSYKSRQNTLGALPQDPGRLQCWIRIEFRREPKFNPYCAQIRSISSLRRHLPFPPTPFPDAGKGLGWAGKWEPRMMLSGC